MTTTNMGICFGVSLISSTQSSSSAMNGMTSPSSAQLTAGNSSPPSSISSTASSTPQHESSSSSSSQHVSAAVSRKMIDMATATNVFDFLLTNHGELLPGDISFSGSGSSGGSVTSVGPLPTPTNAASVNQAIVSSSLNSRHTFYHSSSKQPNVIHGGELGANLGYNSTGRTYVSVNKDNPNNNGHYEKSERSEQREIGSGHSNR